MTALELDHVYTALAEALGRAGHQNTPLLLAILALDLLSTSGDAAHAIAAVARAETLAAI